MIESQGEFTFDKDGNLIRKGSLYDPYQIIFVDQMAKKIVELEKRIEFLEKTEIRRNCD